jgi:hypothetical protein
LNAPSAIICQDPATYPVSHYGFMKKSPLLARRLCSMVFFAYRIGSPK